MHYRKSIPTALAVLGLTFGAGEAAAAGPNDPSRVTADDAAMMAAMQRDLGLSAGEVRKQRALQAKAITLDIQLRASLGATFAGSAYDVKTGKLVVSVSDARHLDDIRAAGADARLVKHSKAELEATKADLDVAAGKAKATSSNDRRATGGARQASVAGMTSWYVDTATNTVHVTVQKGTGKAAKAALAKHGDKVEIEESGLVPTETVNYLDGGDYITGGSGGCSAGFNLRSSWTGVGYLLTAGHCLNPVSTVRGQGGNVFGPTMESWYQWGSDDALVRNDSAGYWIQGPWVDLTPSNGSIFTTRTWTDAPVGTTVCKSGVTTKWTCGSITAKNATVTYTSGVTLYGLTRHNACAEPGDSGGSNLSASTWAAEGVSSGATLIANRCLSFYGQQNVSYYHPIADSLNYYGPRYGVTLFP